MSLGSSFAAGVDQGILTLLGSKTSVSLLKIVPHTELLLLCSGLIACLKSVSSKLPIFGRISGVMAQVLNTIALNTLLSGATVEGDVPLTCANLLSIFFLTGGLMPHGSFPETAQYLVVYNLSTALEGFKAAGLSVAWAFAFVSHVMPVKQDVVQLAQLVTTETVAAWLRAWLPPELLLPTTLILLYLCAPFLSVFPPLQRIYRFAVFAVSNDPQLITTPAWLIAAALWALWQLEPDPVSKVLAARAGTSVGVVALLDAMNFAMDNDPAPTLLGLLIVLRIWEGVSASNS